MEANRYRADKSRDGVSGIQAQGRNTEMTRNREQYSNSASPWRTLRKMPVRLAPEQILEGFE